MRSLVLGLLASTAVVGLPSMPTHASSFSISPIRLDLSTAVRSAALTVRNDDQEVLVQAQVMLWQQVDGEDKLTPTRDLLVSPAVFTLPPNGAQLVRVALRSPPADTAHELSYRLILQEVPKSANRRSLVCRSPCASASRSSSQRRDDRSCPRLVRFSLRRRDCVVTAQNSGDVHARIHGFSIAPTTGDEAPLAQPVAAYVLPGQSRTGNSVGCRG